MEKPKSTLKITIEGKVKSGKSFAMQIIRNSLLAHGFDVEVSETSHDDLLKNLARKVPDGFGQGRLAVVKVKQAPRMEGEEVFRLGFSGFEVVWKDYGQDFLRAEIFHNGSFKTFVGTSIRSTLKREFLTERLLLVSHSLLVLLNSLGPDRAEEAIMRWQAIHNI